MRKVLNLISFNDSGIYFCEKSPFINYIYLCLYFLCCNNERSNKAFITNITFKIFLL